MSAVYHNQPRQPVMLSTAMVQAPEPVSVITADMNARAAACTETTCKRALTLLDDGYTIEPTDRPLVYLVKKPFHVNKKTGVITEFEPYLVDAMTPATCTCYQFSRHGHCKHERAVRVAVLEAMALLAPVAPAPVRAQPKQIACCDCGGCGHVAREVRCNDCNGTGERYEWDGERWAMDTCTTCMREGWIPGRAQCSTCDGSGVIEAPSIDTAIRGLELGRAALQYASIAPTRRSVRPVGTSSEDFS